jgi:chloramphenicol 3-O phosphotransferase
VTTTPLLFLNGTSSAGKTSIAKAFQRLYGEPTLYASVDAFIFMFADHVRANDAVRRRVLPPVISAFHRALPGLAACGFPVVVDHVVESRAWIEECAMALTGVRAYFVGVHCPLVLLEERERNRGDRQVGFARWQFERVHCFGDYDFTIDTSTQSPEDGAQKLIALLGSDLTPRAFARIRSEAGASPSA